MVLSPPAAHDEPRAGEAGWIEQIKLNLGLADEGILIHVDHARLERLGDLVRGLLGEHPDLVVHDDVRTIEEAPDGSTWVLLPKGADADWLNRRRPVFARRRLKVVLFCDHGTTLELMRHAPDFFDWISHQEVCPEGPAAHGVFGLRVALAARAHVAWTGPGDAADLERIALATAAAHPAGHVRWVAPEGDYAALLDAVRSAADAGAWVGCRIRTATHLRRFRWALAEVQRPSRAIAVVGARCCPGFVAVHDRLARFDEARAALEARGLSRAGCIAALVGLEPEAIELACALDGRGTSGDRLIELLLGASDPGAALARALYTTGDLPLESLSLGLAPPPVVRAFLDDPRVSSALEERLSAVWRAIASGRPATDLEIGAWAARHEAPWSIKEAERSVEALGFIMEARLRRSPSADGWVELAEDALVVGDPGPVGVWAENATKAGASPRRLTAIGSQLVSLRDPRGAALLTHIPTRSLPRDLLVPLSFAAAFIAGGVLFVAVKSLAARAFLALGVVLVWALRIGPVVAQVFARSRPTTRPGSVVTAGLSRRLDRALALIDRGSHEEAIGELDLLLVAAEADLGIEHPLFRRGLALLGRARAEQGDDKRAMEVLLRALALEANIAGVGHVSFAEIVMTLAGVLAGTGRSREAERLLHKLLGPSVPPMPEGTGSPGILGNSGMDELLERFLARPETPELSERARTIAVRLLARALVAQGRYADAEMLLVRALDRATRSLPEGDLERSRLLASFGNVLSLRGRHEEALAALRRAEEAARATVGQRHLDLARILRDRARVEHRLERPDAADAARRALAIFTEVAPATPETELATRELTSIAGG